MLIDRGGDVRPFTLTERWDLTKPADLLDLNIWFLKQGQHQKLCFPEHTGQGNCFVPPFYIDDDVHIGSNCQLGPNVYIEYGCMLGDNVYLRDVVVLRNRKVADNTIAEYQLIW